MPVTKMTPGVVVIDDGTREIKIENKFGEEICKVHIRAGDYSILDRYQTVMQDMPNILKPLQEAGIKADGTGELEKDWAIIKQVEKALLDRLAELFDTDDVQLIFKKRNPFSAVGGQFFAMIVLDGLGAEMARVVEEESKLSEKRMSKYLKDAGGDVNGRKSAKGA